MRLRGGNEKSADNRQDQVLTSFVAAHNAAIHNLLLCGGTSVIRRMFVFRFASEMALHVLAYNLTRVMNIIGIQPLIAAMRA